MIKRNAWAEVDLAAIAHNVKENKKVLGPHTKLCAVVKADAYGHGAVKVAQTAIKAGAEFLAVAIAHEALELRQAGITEPILILGAMAYGNEDTLVDNNISQVVFDMATAERLSQAAVKLKKVAKVHIGVETGMNRIGVPYKEVGAFVKKLSALPNLEIEGAFSHFAKADEEDKSFVNEQFHRFEEAMESCRKEGIEIPIKHIANSASIGSDPHLYLDMVRQGITLYGLWPSKSVKKTFDLIPALTLKTRVVFVKEIPPGETIGYGGTYKVEKTMKVATLPIGYADGISRRLSNKGYVLIQGKKSPIVGRVCMDQIMVDITAMENVKIGDEVIVFGGKDLSVDIVADWMETINYEVTCLIGKRIPRLYKNESTF